MYVKQYDRYTEDVVNFEANSSIIWDKAFLLHFYDDCVQIFWGFGIM